MILLKNEHTSPRMAYFLKKTALKFMMGKGEGVGNEYFLLLT